MFEYRETDGWDVSFGRRMPNPPCDDEQDEYVPAKEPPPIKAMPKEVGPIYGVELLDSLPLDGGMSQALPSRRDLDDVRRTKIVGNDRVVAGYEVLLEHYRRMRKESEALWECVERFYQHLDTYGVIATPKHVAESQDACFAAYHDLHQDAKAREER